MKNHKLEIKTSIQISKSAHEVFEAIADPDKISNYFLAQSSARLEEGRAIVWRFEEVDEDVHIEVSKVEKDISIAYKWDVEGHKTMVEISLKVFGPDITIVSVSEKEMENDEMGITWLKGNTEGWANFLACLKAYLEYGINLRKGAFEYRKV